MEGDPIGRPAVSTNPDPRELSKTEPSTRAHMGWTKPPDTYVEDMQLSLLVGPPTTGVEVLPKAVA